MPASQTWIPNSQRSIYLAECYQTNCQGNQLRSVSWMCDINHTFSLLIKDEVEMWVERKDIKQYLRTLPMQLDTQGQWWSNCSTHRSHVEQCFARRGLTIWLLFEIGLINKNVTKPSINQRKLDELLIEQDPYRLPKISTLHVAQSWDQFPVSKAGLFISIFKSGS
jgi:hypothetical protein